MKNLRILSIFIILAVLVTVAGAPTGAAARPSTLGVAWIWTGASSYSVLSGAAVTNAIGVGTSVQGDLGISPGIGAAPHFTGFPPGVVGPPGVIHDADGPAAGAMADHTAALINLQGQACDITYPGVVDLVGMTLAPGVYCAGTSFALSGTLNLIGGASEVYIFKSPSTISFTGTSNVVGGDPCTIFWVANSSADFNTGASAVGDVLALTSVTMANGATLMGRAFAQNAAVTLDNNVITLPVCLVAPVVIVPPVEGLPDTGGAPIRSEAASWTLAIAGIGISAVALVLGIRGSRRNRLPKQ